MAVEKHDIIVIGASAGGVEALKELTRHLPGNLDASIFVVLHIAPFSPSVLPAILSRAGALPAHHAEHGEKIRKGVIYVAPPDRHMLLNDGSIELTFGPKENRHRPAIDVLFRSAALAYGERVVGVVLSGMLDDGTAGLVSIKKSGGLSVVQDPQEARYSPMPRSAIEFDHVDHVVNLADMAALLVSLANQPVEEIPNHPHNNPGPNMQDQLKDEVDFARNEEVEQPHPGRNSDLVCPACGGVLREIQEGKLLRFRCQVGHAYSTQAMLSAQADDVENALWALLRTFEERVLLLRKVIEHFSSSGYHEGAAKYQENAQAIEEQMDIVRTMLNEGRYRPPIIPGDDIPRFGAEEPLL